MAKQIKPKYSQDREKTSEAFKEGKATTQIYSGDQIIITIKGSFNADVVNDLQNSVDDVLKHHGL